METNEIIIQNLTKKLTEIYTQQGAEKWLNNPNKRLFGGTPREIALQNPEGYVHIHNLIQELIDI